MLGYYLNNKPLLLDADTSVRITWYNPCCFYDEIPADKGMGVSIPNNKVNRALLGSPERFEKYSDVSERKFTGFEIRWFGSVLLSGTLNITDGGEDGYSGWLQNEQGVLVEEQKDKKIHEMDWPEDQAFDTSLGLSEDNCDYTGRNAIKNTGFWENIGREEQVGELTRTVLTSEAITNYSQLINIFNPSDLKAGCVISPYLYLRHFLTHLFKINSFNINRNDILDYPDYNNSFLYNLQVYHNFNIVNPDFTIYEREVQEWDARSNEVVTNTRKVVTYDSWAISNFDYSDLVPRIGLGKTLIGMQNFLNFVFWFRDRKTVDIIDRNAVLSSTPIDVSKYAIGKWQKGQQKDVQLKYISETDNEDAMFGENFTDLTDQITDTPVKVDTYNDLDTTLPAPVLNEIRYVKDEDNFYIYKMITLSEHQGGPSWSQEIDVLGWELASCGPQPYVYGSGDEIEEINTAISAIKTNTVNSFEVIQKGNFKTVRSIYNDFGFRLLTDYENDNEFLNWDGDNGLFNSRHKNWARFWATRLPVSRKFNFTYNSIERMKNNIVIPFHSPEGVFVVEKMNVEFQLRSIGETTIEGYKK